MPFYDFECDCGHEDSLSFSMSDDHGRANVKCDKCGKKMRRLYAPAAIVITGSPSSIPCGPNQKVINSDGKAIRLNFVDNGARGLQEGSVARALPGSRMDEKTGRPVVDVVSNVPDPLGAIERDKRKRDCSVESRTIGQKVKTRKRGRK